MNTSTSKNPPGSKPLPPSQPAPTKFGSNLCAVLNDPRKDRAKVAYLFTKTWGSDFVDSAQVPAITTVHAISANKYRNIKFLEFKEHLESFSGVIFFSLLTLFQSFELCAQSCFILAEYKTCQE
jgi:hypothetical protein